jgi:hypothetical protein
MEINLQTALVFCLTLAWLLSSFSLYYMEYCTGDGKTGINEWCITRLLQQTPCKKHLWIVTAVLLKHKTTLLSIPDSGDNIYVLIDRTRQRSMLTVHHSNSPKSYNKIPANIIIVYA